MEMTIVVESALRETRKPANRGSATARRSIPVATEGAFVPNRSSNGGKTYGATAIAISALAADLQNITLKNQVRQASKPAPRKAVMIET
jgi:hypothetical protein